MSVQIDAPEGDADFSLPAGARPTIASNQDRADFSAPADRQLLGEIMTMLGRRTAVHMELRRAALALHHTMSTCDLRVLEQVAELGPLTVSQLARVAGMSASGITGIVDRLDHAGLIRRTRHPLDRRIVLLAANDARCAALHAPIAGRPTAAERFHSTPQTVAQVHAFLTHYVGELRDGTLRDAGDQRPH